LIWGRGLLAVLIVGAVGSWCRCDTLLLAVSRGVIIIIIVLFSLLQGEWTGILTIAHMLARSTMRSMCGGGMMKNQGVAWVVGVWW